jgi:hypothetical protein
VGKWTWLLAAALLLPAACLKLKHEMVIQPVHVTVDVRIKIDRELENFFGEIDKAAAEEEPGAKKAEEVK